VKNIWQSWREDWRRECTKYRNRIRNSKAKSHCLQWR